MINLVQMDQDIWVNVGSGNVDYVNLDPPMGNDRGPRVMIRFKNGFGHLLPFGIELEIAVSRLMGKPVTAMGNQWWCEGDIMKDARTHEHCTREKPHGPHGYDIPDPNDS